MGKQQKQNKRQTFFSRPPKSLQMVTAATKLKDTCSWKKSYDQPRQHIKKQRHYFTNKGLYSQSYGVFFFPVVMYGCESWTIEKAEHQRIDAFELWCWRRCLRVHWGGGTGLALGSTCVPVADSCQCMAKIITLL